MATSPMVTVFAPDGTSGDIPYDRLHDAIAAGGKLGVNVKSPDGKTGVIPADQLQAAQKVGAQILPYNTKGNAPEGGGFGQGVKDALPSGSGVAKSVGMNALTLGMSGGFETAKALFNAAKNAKKNFQTGSENITGTALDDPLKVNRVMSGAVNAVGPLVGVDPQQMAATARQGDTGGVLGQAAVPAAATMLSYGIAKGAGKLAEAMPNAERAANSLGEIKNAAGDVPIDMEKPGNTALKIYENAEHGATLPPTVRKFINWATNPDKEPMTYADAKDFQSNISKLSADEYGRMNPNTKRLVGQLNADLKESLTGAADTVGKGQQFQQAMKEYSNAMRIKGISQDAANALWKAALASGGIYGLSKILGFSEAPKP